MTRASDGAWEREEGVTCVVCPSCAFTFDAFHTDADGGYSCPACAEPPARSAASGRGVGTPASENANVPSAAYAVGDPVRFRRFGEWLDGVVVRIENGLLCIEYGSNGSTLWRSPSNSRVRHA